MEMPRKNYIPYLLFKTCLEKGAPPFLSQMEIPLWPDLNCLQVGKRARLSLSLFHSTYSWISVVIPTYAVSSALPQKLSCHAGSLERSTTALPRVDMSFCRVGGSERIFPKEEKGTDRDDDVGLMWNLDGGDVALR